MKTSTCVLVSALTIVPAFGTGWLLSNYAHGDSYQIGYETGRRLTEKDKADIAAAQPAPVVQQTVCPPVEPTLRGRIEADDYRRPPHELIDGFAQIMNSIARRIESDR